MPGKPGIGGQNRTYGTGKAKAMDSPTDVRPKANKVYYWQSLKQTTTVETIRKAIVNHLKKFNVEAPDDLVRYLSYDYYTLLHAQRVYDAWNPPEEMPKFGRRFVSNEIDELYANINELWTQIQSLAKPDEKSVEENKEKSPEKKYQRKIPGATQPVAATVVIN